ncbi:Ribonuclease H-like domain containing protein [Elaphomyces granulatus]
MDVTRKTFPFYLPRILHDLTTCCFVCLDLEFSGIHAKTEGRLRDGMQTLQERYTEVRGAAEVYQILQIGLTIAHEDLNIGQYTLKTYTFLLNPIIDRRLEVERVWSYQSSAIEFLLRNNFRMQAVYEEGIPYISRQEEALAITKTLERNHRIVRTKIDIQASDHESVEFLDGIRREINAWLSDEKATDDFLNIPPPRSRNEPRSPSEKLSTYQRKLIHQVVEIEYPSLVTDTKQSFIQISHHNEVKRGAVNERRLKRTEHHVLKQMGFRWIVEAIAGGDLSKLDSQSFSEIMSSPKVVEGNDTPDEFLEKTRKRLKAKRFVLVGHNSFTDLVYFSKCFFESLPERVEDFQAMIHQRFPFIIDTKFMATYKSSSTASPSLSEISERLLKVEGPETIIDPLHGKYNEKQLFHDAGYDSLRTAEIFIKLAAQQAVECTSNNTGSEDSRQESRFNPPSALGGNSTTIPETDGKEPPEKRLKVAERAVRSAFAHSTKFDILAELEGNVEGSNQDGDETMAVEDGSTLNSEYETGILQRVKDGKLIPCFESTFWDAYRNQLRVFGTQEEFCKLENV